MERKILHLLSYNSVHWLLLNYTPLERRAQLIKMLTHISLSLLGKTISLVSFSENHGVSMDQYLTYDVHITKSASNCMNS